MHEEQQIKKLMTEVDKNKRQRVILARKMADKAEQHRVWIAEKNKNIEHLKKEANKTKAEMQKFKVMPITFQTPSNTHT